MGFSGERSMQFWRVMHMCILLMFCFVLSSCASLASAGKPEPTAIPKSPDNGDVVVYVVNDKGESLFDNAVVSTSYPTQADDKDYGALRLQGCDAGQYMTAWAQGYYNRSLPCETGKKQYNFQLERIDTNLNPSHSWASARSNCINCHQDGGQYNEYPEWEKTGHAKGFTNRYFETMYLGTFLNGGGVSPQTNRDVIDNDLVQRAPVFGTGYYGPGYKLDYPNSNGNCAFCHAPVAVAKERTEINPFLVSGTVQEGITCDICHKVFNVEIGDGGVPYETHPGVLSFEYLLPSNYPNFYIGPLTKINQPESLMRTSCSTIFSKSEFCAACHYGKFYDTVIYGSYQEWKESPYAVDPSSETYQTCQDCHMSPNHGIITGSLSEQRQACSANNNFFSNFDHNVMNFDTNRNIPLMVEGAAQIETGFLSEVGEKDWITVIAKVTSVGVGHRFPTDSPLRHLILVVEAKDQRDVPLAHVDGERIPNWAGAGNPPPNQGILNYGGLPGKIFANLLIEEDTNISPTAAYWNKTKYAWVGVLETNSNDKSDTRLLPGESDESMYSFAPPEEGDFTVTIKLIYRFAFMDIMWQKGWWDRPDILVTQVNWECKRIGETKRFNCLRK